MTTKVASRDTQPARRNSRRVFPLPAVPNNQANQGFGHYKRIRRTAGKPTSQSTFEELANSHE